MTDDSIDERGEGSPVSAARRLPTLVAGLICERILVEQDGTISAIRLIDRFRWIRPTSNGRVPPCGAGCWPPFVPVVPVGGFRCGSTRFRPSGARFRGPVLELVIDEGGPQQGGSVVLDLTVEFTEIGLHWIEVYLEGGLVTQMPITFVVELALLEPSHTGPPPGANLPPTQPKSDRR